jgi:hypothetical protein
MRCKQNRPLDGETQVTMTMTETEFIFIRDAIGDKTVEFRRFVNDGHTVSERVLQNLETLEDMLWTANNLPLR